MLKKLVILAGFVLFFGVTAYTYAAVDTDIPMRSVASVIDGQKDTVWNTLEGHKLTHYISGATGAADSGAIWRAYWDADYIYVFVDVNDDTIKGDSAATSKYEDDSVEIFLDIHNNNATTWVTNADDYQYRFYWNADNTAGIAVDHTWNSMVGIEYKIVTTTQGYALEAKLPWSILYLNSERPSVGDLIGFEVQINDDDDGSARDTQLSWYATANNVYNNPSNMGTVDLLGLVGFPNQAGSPKPLNADTGISIDTMLSWKPGVDASKHNVFIGTDVNAVTNATLENPLGTTSYQGLDVNTVDIARLVYETTYYWRVDEVTAAPGSVITAGSVWKFTTEAGGIAIPKTSIIDVTTTGEPAYPGEQEPNYTCNGKGLDGNDIHTDKYPDMWLVSADGPGIAWIQYEFDMVYKLYDMLVWNYNEESPGQGFGVQDANVAYSMDGETWTALPLQKFNEATGDNTYKANTDVKFNGATAKFVRITFLTSFEGSDVYGLSEVRFLAEPTRVQNPTPASGSTTLQAINAALKWKPGRYVDKHYVYISTDANDVNNVPGHSVDPIIVSDANVIPGLDLGKKYYWRVDEVNMVNTYTTWTGPTWNLSTVASLVLDDFEKGYGNNPDTNAVWVTWVDGLSSASNGSTIGSGDAPGLNTKIYHGASGKSAPVYYDNTGTAETDSFVTAQSVKLQQKTNDWSKGHPTALVIWFRGDPNNIPDQMYVKLNSTKITYNGDPGYLAQSLWRPWSIDLTSMNLSNISSITIGLEKTGTQGGKGILYFDDIALYGVAPATAAIAQPVNPGNTGLVAYYSMENSLQDLSGNGHNGTFAGTGTPTYMTGMSGHETALKLNGSSDAVNLGQNAAFNFESSFTISVWAKISAWSTGWTYDMVANRGESDKGGWQIRRSGSNRFAFTTRGLSNEDMTSTANPPPLNEWVNFTCVYDSEAFNKKIYIDGMLDNTVALTGTVKTVKATTGIDTYIGARAKADNTGPENFFNGMLDEVRIYNRALSAGEAAFLADPTP